MQNNEYVKKKPANTCEINDMYIYMQKSLTICTYSAIVRPCKRATKVFRKYYIVFQMQL
jgi:hypothetical protein